MGITQVCSKNRPAAAGARVDAIDLWSAKIRELESRITVEREKALAGPPSTSYFVFFNSQKDAAIAAQVNLHAEDGHHFRVFEAPGPEEVSSSPLLCLSQQSRWA